MCPSSSKKTLKMSFFLTAIIFSVRVYAVCAPRIAHFPDLFSIAKEAALVTKENRRLRTSSNFESNLEKAQGRVWCFRERLNYVPSPAELANLSGQGVFNATEVLESGMIVGPRHPFYCGDSDAVLRNSKKRCEVYDPQNCFYESISSGDVVRISRHVRYDLFQVNDPGSDSDVARSEEQDYALMLLERDVRGGVPIPREGILINQHREEGYKLSVVSNFADNAPKGKKLSPTIANCSIKRRMGISPYEPARVVATDCNTGRGSSGSPVFVKEGDRRMLYGMVYGEDDKRPPGSGFVLKQNDTMVVLFGSDLLYWSEELSQIKQTQHAEK
jgi:hypothetical protein